MSISVSYTTSTRPSLPYKKIKDDIMGSDYSLSLVFIGDAKSRALNVAHRKKTYVPNVLSFPLTDTAGEIFINPRQAKKEAPKHGMRERTYLAYLLIHGLLHLKGYQHSARMEEAENRYLKRHGFAR